MNKSRTKKIDLSNSNEFIDMVNHELKSPLVTIKISTELTQRQFKSESKYKSTLIQNLEKINTKVDCLTQLINDYTDLIKLQNNNLTINNNIYFTEQLIINLKDNLNIKFFESIKLNHKVLVDFSKFVQVILGLISYLPKISLPDSKIGLSIRDDNQQILFYLYSLKKIPLNNFNFELDPLWQEKKPDRINTIYASEILNRSNGSFKNFYNRKIGAIFCFSLPIIS